MKLVNTNDEKFFDPTPRLKSSPIPIKFISFNGSNTICIYCGEKYIETLLCHNQKYCKKCLSRYINDITDNKIYLDIHCTMELECNEHEIRKVPQSIQECCRNCIRILCFKQIIGSFNEYPTNNNYTNILYNKVIKDEKHCQLCGKSLDERTAAIMQLRLCSDCYLISFERIESPFAKKRIPIFYLPWWYNSIYCKNCSSKLIFTSECQKYCKNCLIFYTGCSYCLTTNIIFGLTSQSQCKKYKLANIVKTTDKYFKPSTLLYSIFKGKNSNSVRWIPYSQFTDVKEMTKGGYGIIYKASWLINNETVILKRFENSKNNIKYFLNELKSNQLINKVNNYIIQIYGFTKDPELEDYILIYMEYASKGDLHKYLQNNFTNITWKNHKLRILRRISAGLDNIHDNKFIHRDFHSGNILLDVFQWKIGDLGLSQSENSESSNNEIYGVILYIAPEIFKGSAFSKEADIYSLERPNVTEDTPECYANLMKSCWDPDPKKRPPIKEIYLALNSWFREGINETEFEQAEAKRKRLIESKKIGPEFAEKCHPEAIYTSRPLSALISKCLSTNSSSTISFDYDYNYISKEKELDIDIKGLSSQNITIQNSSTSLKKRNQEELNLETQENIVGKRIKIS
ncbi:unnamed protein product [Rhizophagus irregularis]|nr:unnamed protein product [Rhizophagus irregularis]